jgi:hypothetical protein
VVALVRNRRYVVPALAAPFRGLPSVSPQPEPQPEPELAPSRGGGHDDLLPLLGRSGGAGTAVLEAPARSRQRIDR